MFCCQVVTVAMPAELARLKKRGSSLPGILVKDREQDETNRVGIEWHRGPHRVPGWEKNHRDRRMRRPAPLRWRYLLESIAAQV